MGCVECGASTRSDWVRRVRDDGSLRSAEWRARSAGGEEWGTSDGGVDGEVGQVVARSECGEEWGTSEGGVEWVVGE